MGEVSVFIFVAMCVCCQLHVALGGMETSHFVDGVTSKLFIKKESVREDFNILRNLTADCVVNRVIVLYMDHEFHLTASDIEILYKCPLDTLDIASETVCFPPSAHIDMSGLTTLTLLQLGKCKRGSFVITGLPNSLASIDMEYLEEHNFQVGGTTGRFGDSLGRLMVTKPSLCCPEALAAMFGRDLPELECRSRNMITIKCGYVDNGTTLAIVRHSDIALFRNRFNEDCRLTELYVDLPDYTLTQEDVGMLEHCPLTQLLLQDSHCFSGSNVDLSGLTHLMYIYISFCRSSDFVITKLPASLEEAWLLGLAEFNIRLQGRRDKVLGHGDEWFGENLKDLIVYTSAMCCEETQRNMFSINLSHVCRGAIHSLDSGKCGWDRTYSFRQVLSVDTRELMHSFTGSLEECGDQDDKGVPVYDKCAAYLLDNACDVKMFAAVGRSFYLQQRDIDLLSRCPLKDMILPYTSCFSGSIDLSYFHDLETLSIPHCTQSNFTITALPARLRNLDIRGLNTGNIQLSKPQRISNISFGASLRQMEVSNPNTCGCPQSVERMFGNPLVENITCGLTPAIFSAVNLIPTQQHYGLMDFSGGFVPNGIGSAISSCDSLVEDLVLRHLMLGMAGLAVGGNSMAIGYRILFDRQSLKKSYGIYPFNLAISDLLMGVYLVIITNADNTFRGHYVLFDKEWRQGLLCHLAGFLCTLSSELSAMFILLITIDRFLSIQFPFGQYKISLKATWILAGTMWVIGLHIASLPLIYEWESYSHHSICVGLPLNTESYPGSTYATGVFLGLNSGLFLLIAIGQLIILRANWSNTKCAGLRGEQAKRRFRRDMIIARQLSIVVITNFLGWFPICVMGVLARRGHRIPDTAYAWAAVVALPINSSINPFLYNLKRVFAAVAVKYTHLQNTLSVRTSYVG